MDGAKTVSGCTWGRHWWATAAGRHSAGAVGVEHGRLRTGPGRARGEGILPSGLGPGQAGWLRAGFKRIWTALFLWTGPNKPFSNIPKIIQISN
jgi:hypothetical protein